MASAVRLVLPKDDVQKTVFLIFFFPSASFSYSLYFNIMSSCSGSPGSFIARYHETHIISPSKGYAC